MRASSPSATAGLTTVAQSMNSLTTTSRTYGLSMIEEINALIAAVPVPFRAAISAGLREIYELEGKLCRQRATLVLLRGHQAQGTFPPQIAAFKEPEFQVTREFGTSQLFSRESFATALTTFKINSLAAAIELKDSEVTFLEGELTVETCVRRLIPAIQTAYNNSKEKNLEPVWHRKSSGELILRELKETEVFVGALDNFLQDLPAYVARCIGIADHEYNVERIKREKKVTLKEKADVEMGDDTAQASTIRKMVQSEIRKAVNARAGSSTVRDHQRSTDVGSVGDSRTFSDFAQKGLLRKNEKSSKKILPPQRPEHRGLIARSKKGHHPQAAWEEGTPQEGGPQRKGEREGQVDYMSAVLVRVWNRPFTYADHILTIPESDAITAIISETPLHVLEAAKYKKLVHKGPGVELNEFLQTHLSTGLKYMFPVKRNRHLIIAAYKDFCDRLRWRINFLLKPKQHVKWAFDPDYEVARTELREAAAPSFDFIEEGLLQGLLYLEQLVYVPETITDKYKDLRHPLALLERTLQSKNYLVLPTDKNLGCAVVTRQWFEERCLDLLSDTLNYEELSHFKFLQVVQDVIYSAESAADLAAVFDNPQLDKYLRSKIPMDSDAENYKPPTFYGIPKIHKKPTKMRPILPCHSAIINPFAKYVSKHLKPVVNSIPTIIRGSKDLVSKLSSIKLPFNRRIFLVTGDVVACYPNIPLEKALDIVFNFWAKFGDLERTPEEIALFDACLQVGNRNLVFQFMDRYFRQKRGLAMGVADSPDIANLYGAFFEQNITDPNILFYGRFIDDCFSIVTANSPEHAITIMAEAIKMDELEITWLASEHNIVFLDMVIYHTPGASCVDYMPYRKALNNLERIPWISAHPLDVKRGTFLGEMSRLATLSSNTGNYGDAIIELKKMYIARGYPEPLVKSWIKNNMSTRWKMRLEKRDDDTSAFVLKSHFNTVWNLVDTTLLCHTIVDHWSNWLYAFENDLLGTEGFPSLTRGDLLPDSDVLHPNRLASTALPRELAGKPVLVRREVSVDGLQGSAGVFDPLLAFGETPRLIVSRKRNRNLGDVINTWRRSMIYNMSIDSGIPIEHI